MNVLFTYAPGRPAAEVVEEELEDDPVEMANLTTAETGVAGTIFVSTQQGKHGPRVKWYPGRPGGGRPFLTVTIENPPRILNHGLRANEAIGAVGAAEWVELNRDALLHFWHQGTELTLAELNAFMLALKKLPDGA